MIMLHWAPNPAWLALKISEPNQCSELAFFKAVDLREDFLLELHETWGANSREKSLSQRDLSQRFRSPDPETPVWRAKLGTCPYPRHSSHDKMPATQALSPNGAKIYCYVLQHLNPARRRTLRTRPSPPKPAGCVVGFRGPDQNHAQPPENRRLRSWPGFREFGVQAVWG